MNSGTQKNESQSNVASPFSGNRAYTLSETESAVLHAIRGMKFGSLEITMHDAKIVQIQKTEKMRFTGDSKTE